MKIGILGCGFSGRTIGQRLSNKGLPVWGTTRTTEKFPGLEKVGVKPLQFDGETISSELIEHLATTTHLVISIAPPREEDPSKSITDPFLAALANKQPVHSLLEISPKLEWAGYLSTVGVYGNHDGAWVDETTKVAPISARSRQRVKAENEWLTLGSSTELTTSVFRLSGIYGPGRNALVTASNGKSRRLVKKNQVFNRIHVADIAEAIDSAAHKNADGIFNITDDQPAPPQDVVTFAHEVLGTIPPDELDFETADLSPMARSFYGENKRVSNQKSKDILGMTYAYPNYTTALTKMYSEQNWKG